MDKDPAVNFFSTYRFWAGSSVVSSVLLVNFAPQYSICQSYYWTAITVFLSQCLVYVVYAVVIYPRYLSPLRDLPMPKVRNICALPIVFGRVELT